MPRRLTRDTQRAVVGGVAAGFGRYLDVDLQTIERGGRVDGSKVAKQEVLFKGIGRVRDVVSGPDGLVYVAFNSPDRVARLLPATP